ncbi:MAG: hypothetical protein KDA79_08855 [Planctomycetaceae bacterium]|nr:hypothetical protein [Planctomycetaceae bacterium]
MDAVRKDVFNQWQASRQHGDSGGNYYALDDPPMEGWICPALFKYYEKAPANLFVRAEPIRR